VVEARSDATASLPPADRFKPGACPLICRGGAVSAASTSVRHPATAGRVSRSARSCTSAVTLSNAMRHRPPPGYADVSGYRDDNPIGRRPSTEQRHLRSAPSIYIARLTDRQLSVTSRSSNEPAAACVGAVLPNLPVQKIKAAPVTARPARAAAWYPLWDAPAPGTYTPARPRSARRATEPGQ
jgi:hypothetical protein